MNKVKKKRKWKITPYTMIAPFFILYFIFGLYPILYSLLVSLYDWSGFGDKIFVGAANYIRIFTQDSKFLKSILNTILIFIFTVPIMVMLGLFTACVLKDFLNKSRNAVQLINFLPYVTTSVAIGIIFSLMFDWKTGIVNGILNLFGIESVYWLGLPWASRVVVIAMVVWKGYGYVMVMFLSGLSTISDDLYEAAKIDGAGWWQSFRKITLPMLKPIMLFVITTNLINAWKLFDEPQLLFSGGSQPIGGPEGSVMTVLMRYYDITFRSFQFGYGAAYGTIIFIIIALTSVITIKLMNRDKDK